jgi:histone arginine demethylase JMJD6
LIVFSQCLIKTPTGVSHAFRPVESCNFCRGIREAVALANILPDEFEAKYAYSGTPVIVVDAMQNWTAPATFDFWFFRDLYLSARRDFFQCQFFPYKTEFRDFYEALSMEATRINYEPGTKPWYIGWSNCDPKTGDVLRRHYDRPYFLPRTSENNAVDWIFMGGPGLGAHMHVDNVRLPSWQAQLKGTKMWTLAPPPECYYQCHSFEVVVRPGDISTPNLETSFETTFNFFFFTVVLDTNKWYHKTTVQPGELSITIGAEYD